MQTLKNWWNNFKTQPDIWFFYGFLATFTLSIRKVIKFYPLAGEFNEYAGIYLYLSDIFVFLALLSWGVIILQNKSLNLSSIKLAFGSMKPIFRFLLLFNLYIFISILWSDNQALAIFRAVKISEFSLLFLYTALRIVPPQYKCSTPVQMFHPDTNVPRGTFYGAGARLASTSLCESRRVEHSTGQAWNILRGRRGTLGNLSLFKRERWRGIFKILIIIGLFQAIIGIGQFFMQKSVGLFWLKESLISPDLPGVAKIIFDGEKYIRAYGLFPHPNILGGFLVFSIIMTWAYYKMFHTYLSAGPGCIGDQEHREEAKIPLDPPFTKGEKQDVPRGTITRTLMFHPRTNVPPQCKCSTPIQMFHPNTNVPRGTFFGAGARLASTSLCESRRVEHSSGQTWNILRGRWSIASGLLFSVFISIQLLALLLTFSKSAIIGLILAIVYILWKIHSQYQNANIPPQCECSTSIQMFHPNANVPRGTLQSLSHAANRDIKETYLTAKQGSLNNQEGEGEAEIPLDPPFTKGENQDVPRGTITRIIMFHVEHYWKEILICVLSLVIGFNYLNLDWNTFLLKSLDERKVYLTTSWEAISNNPYLGVGIGQSVLDLNNNVPRGTFIEPWQYQPVHNVFLLIWSELGLVGLALFLAFLWNILSLKKNRVGEYSASEENTEPEKYVNNKAFATSSPGTLFDDKLENIEDSNVPPQYKCSTPIQMFHPDINVPRGTFCGAGVEHSTGQAWNILRGRRGTLAGDYLFRASDHSILTLLTMLLKSVIIGLLFIMLFDHYLWDIQPGQILLWLALGLFYGLASSLSLQQAGSAPADDINE